jgi:hypothetical protein
MDEDQNELAAPMIGGCTYQFDAHTWPNSVPSHHAACEVYSLADDDPRKVREFVALRKERLRRLSRGPGEA